MNIAVISFDQDFINQIRRELPDESIRGYIDSLSMLKELSEFNPDIIIYDASSGDFAIDDLKFLLTREKVEKKKFRILLSREQPVDIDSFPEVEDIIYYTKETDIPKLLSDIKAETGSEEKKKEVLDIGESEFSSPEDIESLLESSQFEEEIPEPSVDFAENFGDFSVSEEEAKEIKESLEFSGKKKEPEIETPFEETFGSFEEQKPEPQPVQQQKPLPPEQPKVQTSSSGIKLEIEISLDEIKKTIAREATDKLVEKLLKDPETEELINNIQRDFVERTEEELEKIKEEIKQELKNRLISSIEGELKDSLVNTVKEEVSQITAKMVKEKLEQLFGGKGS